MRLRFATVVVSAGAWLGVPLVGGASEPQSRATSGAESSPSTTSVATLPDSASYGPPRRGAWRIDANVPQTWGEVEREPVREPLPPLRSPYRRYAGYPYEAETRGYVLRGEASADQRLPGRLHTGRLAIEGGQSGPEQGRAGIALRFAFSRVGFDSSVASHFGGPRNPQGPLRVTLIAGSTNGLFALVLRPKLMWWVGAGVNYASPGSSRAGVGVGPNFTSTIDAFVRRPLVMSVRGDVGSIDGAPMVAGRGTLGFMLKSFELYAGYEARRQADLLLLGPMLGARAWF